MTLNLVAFGRDHTFSKLCHWREFPQSLKNTCLKVAESLSLTVTDRIGHFTPLDRGSNFFLEFLVHLRIEYDCQQCALNRCGCGVRTSNPMIVQSAEWELSENPYNVMKSSASTSGTSLSMNEVSRSEVVPALTSSHWTLADRMT